MLAFIPFYDVQLASTLLSIFASNNGYKIKTQLYQTEPEILKNFGNIPNTNTGVFFCLCWGLPSQSTIFQSYRDRATASWVINQYFRGVKCLAQGHNKAAVGFEPPTSRSGVRHSTTEPPRSPKYWCIIKFYRTFVLPIDKLVGQS